MSDLVFNLHTSVISNRFNFPRPSCYCVTGINSFGLQSMFQNSGLLYSFR